MFFGNRLKKDALNVIKKSFAYDVGPLQKPLFDAIVKEYKQLGGNEFDVAITFVLVCCNSLDPSDPRAQPFIKNKINHVNRIRHKANMSNAEIDLMISEVGGKDFVALRGAANTQSTAKSFEQWFDQFSAECERLKPGLGDMIEFMDQTPLKRAHLDNQDPNEIALHFAQTFDPRSFGR